MPKVTFQGNEFETHHEATCAALFIRYGWRWERPKHPLGGWLPDFLLRGDTSVYVECKGGLKWEDVPRFPELTRYEDAVSGTSDEVLLIPDAPRRIQNDRGYPASILGYGFRRSGGPHPTIVTTGRSGWETRGRGVVDFHRPPWNCYNRCPRPEVKNSSQNLTACATTSS